MRLNYEVKNRIAPYTAPEEHEPSSGTIFTTIEYHANSIYECKNKDQMIKYYHASLGLHTKTTLIAAAKSGYLRECPGLEAKAISKYIAVEDTAEMGHMKHIPKGVKSTTTKSRRGRPAKLMQPSERTEAMEDATSTPTQ